MHRCTSFPVNVPAAPLSWGAPVLAAIVGFVLSTVPVAASPSLETFVLSVGGRSNFGPPGCTTFGAPAPVADFFGPYGASLPIGGLETCIVAGSFHDMTSPTGPLSDTLSLGSAWTTNVFSGATAVVLNYGSYSAQAHAEFTGDFTSLNVTGAEGFGIADDSINVTTPSIANGQPGSIVFRATVTGGLSTTSTGGAGVKLDYSVNAGPLFTMLTSIVEYVTLLPTLTSVGSTGLGGFTLSPGAMSGSGEVSSGAIPIVFGTSFDFKLGLLAYAVPALTSIVDSDFDAVITDIEVKGPGGEILTDFVITSASGTQYGGTNVTAVEEFVPWELNEFAGLSVFPNPSRGQVELRFNLRMPGATSLVIYNTAGRLIRQMDVTNGRAGSQSVLWDGRNDQGALSPSGVYFARLAGQSGSATTRLTLLH